MGNIYRTAKRVVIWLGDSDETSDDAIAFLEKIDFAQIRHPHDAMKFYSDPSNFSECQKICLLCQREWWSRAWIVQEIANAREALYYVGSKTIESNQLRLFLFSIFKLSLGSPYREVIRSAFGGTAKAAQLILITDQIRSRDALIDDGDLANSQRTRDCINPSDKIFSILSLMSQQFQDRVIPDYSKSVEWTYCLTVKALIETNENINILLYSMPFTKINCPSWCPDWNEAIGCLPLRASGFSTCGNAKPIAKFSADLRAIYLNGCVLIDLIDNARVQQRSAQEEQCVYTPLFRSADDPQRENKHWVLKATHELCQQKNTNTSLLDALVSGRFILNGENEKFEVHSDEISAEVLDSAARREPSPLCKTYMEYADVKTFGRTVFPSENGWLGLGPRAMRKNDAIFVIAGCAVPVILREQPDRSYIWVGGAYIKGLMYGSSKDDDPYDFVLETNERIKDPSKGRSYSDKTSLSRFLRTFCA